MSFNISEVADYLGIEKLQDTGGDSIPICLSVLRRPARKKYNMYQKGWKGKKCIPVFFLRQAWKYAGFVSGSESRICRSRSL